MGPEEFFRWLVDQIDGDRTPPAPAPATIGSGPAGAAARMGTTIQNPVRVAPPGQLGHSAQAYGATGNRLPSALDNGALPQPRITGKAGATRNSTALPTPALPYGALVGNIGNVGANVANQALRAVNATTGRTGQGGVAGGSGASGGNPSTAVIPYTIGGAHFADVNALIEAAKNNPALGAQIRNLANGQKGRTTSILGKHMDNLYGRAIQAALATAGQGESGNGAHPLLGVLEGAIGASLGNGAGFVPYMGQLAQQTLSADMSGWDDDTVKTALTAANALGSLGLGDIAAGGLDSQLDDLLYQMNTRVLTDPAAKEGGVLAQLLAGSGYQRAMQQYAAMR